MAESIICISMRKTGGALKIEKVDWDSEIFPKELKEIQSPPKELYCIGNLDLLSMPKISVVGSRRCTSYGKTVARQISKRMANCDVVIVSGLAKGIDREAHSGSLEHGGKTIAVLATAIDKCYPASNRDLYNIIAKEGLLLSERAPGYIAQRYDFPHRNRIISGISLATIVVEAPSQSGAIITGELTMEQGRELYAVPGNITSFFSLGTNKLIRDGAKALTIVDDLIEDLDLTEIKREELKEELSPTEIMIVDILQKHGELSMEELFQLTEIEIPKLSGLLTILEMKGAIRLGMGKFFVEIP